MTLQPGDFIQGSYRVVQGIGQAGFGATRSKEYLTRNIPVAVDAARSKRIAIMVQQRRFQLQLPKSLSKSSPQPYIQNDGVVVIVGANGSGKTRLGTWIEFDCPSDIQVHRVAAQKSLHMPVSTNITSFDMARRALIYGVLPSDISSYQHILISDDNQKYHRRDIKWNSNPNTTLLDDFEALMVYLYSEAAQVSTDYTHRSQATNDRLEPPTTKLDKSRR